MGLDARASIGLADLGHVHLTDSKEALARSPAKPEEDLPALLEPLEFCLAVPTGTGASMMPAAAVPAATAGTTLPLAWPLMERLVRRLALGGNGRSGTARIEIGAGELTGATLLLTAEAGTVDVAVELPAGAAPGDWEVRLRDRLARSGVPVGSISVR